MHSFLVDYSASPPLEIGHWHCIIEGKEAAFIELSRWKEGLPCSIKALAQSYQQLLFHLFYTQYCHVQVGTFMNCE